MLNEKKEVILLDDHIHTHTVFQKCYDIVNFPVSFLLIKNKHKIDRGNEMCRRMSTTMKPLLAAMKPPLGTGHGMSGLNPAASHVK